MQHKKKWDEMSLSQWLLHHQRNIHFKYKYYGLDMQKNPMDMMIYMELIHRVKPEFIIEIGAAGGGTALWLCHQMDILNDNFPLEHGLVLSVDINHGGFKAKHPRLRKITGDSTKVLTATQTAGFMGLDELDKKENQVLVIHDGSHKKEDIKKDFKNFSPFVSVGSYFIVEDGIMDVFGWKDHRTEGHDCGMIAAQEIANENPGWVIDTQCEKYIMTYNPSGYLRRDN